MGIGPAAWGKITIATDLLFMQLFITLFLLAVYASSD